MRSKRSCYDSVIFRKNLTRFAPAWGLYTLCLALGILLTYHNGGTAKAFHFGSNLADLIPIMSMINLIYAPLVAQLLFGDLYTARMCNALHAMPVRRECWLVTNVLSGLAFSLIPTAIMVIICLPLLSGSYFVNAWQIPLYVFVGINLEYICFFGMAVFCALCVGNRLSMVMLYGLLNFGAVIAYWLIDTLYTPMLYGVVTPTQLVGNLFPVAQFLDKTFIETGSLYNLREIFGDELKGAFATFTLTEHWSMLLIWAGVGIGFLALALVLYQKRNLECAGDAMAFKVLEPVFQILCAVVTAAAAQFFITDFLGFNDRYYYIFLVAGLIIGWFACRMLIERSSRVFRLKNWYGLAVLTAAIALSLFLTYVDIFGIEDWTFNVEEIESATLSYNYELTEEEDIQKVLDMQSEALQTRLEDSGAYLQDENGQWVRFLDNGLTSEELKEYAELDARYAYYVNLTYTLKSGKEVTRRYPIWADSKAADGARDIFSRWEHVAGRNDRIYVNGKETEISVLEEVLNTLESMHVDGMEPIAEGIDRAMAEDLLTAIKADCEEGNMAQVRYLHQGHFRKENPENESGYYYRPYLYLDLNGKNYGWGIDIYPECENTLQWLREHDMLYYEIMDNTLCFY